MNVLSFIISKTYLTVRLLLTASSYVRVANVKISKLSNNYKKAWSNKNSPSYTFTSMQCSCTTLHIGQFLRSSFKSSMLCIAATSAIFWTLDILQKSVSLSTLYRKTEPLSAKMAGSRRRMFGHILRGPIAIDGPAFCSLIFAINISRLPGRRGRSHSNLLFLIVQDLRMRNLLLNNIHDLYYSRHIASDRNSWTKLQSLT